MKEFRYLYGTKRAVESNLSRIAKHVGSGLVTLSACRQSLTEDENLKRSELLVAELRKLGYGYIPLVGSYIEEETGEPATEHSFLIPYPNKRELSFEEMVFELQVVANSFNQDSILVVNQGKGYLLYSDGHQDPVGSFNLDNNTASPYFSTLAKGNHRNRKWVFEGVLSKPETLLTLWGSSRDGEIF